MTFLGPGGVRRREMSPHQSLCRRCASGVGCWTYAGVDNSTRASITNRAKAAAALLHPHKGEGSGARCDSGKVVRAAAAPIGADGWTVRGGDRSGGAEHWPRDSRSVSGRF